MIKLHNRVRTTLLGTAMALPMAGSVAASDCCRWELVVQPTSVGASTFTAELWAHFPSDGYSFGDGILSIRSDGVIWTASEFCGGPSRHGVQGGVVLGGPDLADLHTFYDVTSGEPLDPSNPIRVWCGEFETDCGVPGELNIWTETKHFGYYDHPLGPTQIACEAVESQRTVLCNPLVVGGWLAVPDRGTDSRVLRDTLELSPGRAGGEIGASIAPQTMDWTAPASLGAQIDLGSLDPGAGFGFTWVPQINCGLLPDPEIRIAAMLQRGALVVEPDFSRVGITAVPVRGYRDGRLVTESVVTIGGALTFSQICLNPTWSYELNQFDQLVLVLSCDDWFYAQLPGQRETEVDRIELAPRGTEGVFGGADRVKVRASGTEKLTVLDVRSGATACYADCDGDGELDFFDFLCFQDAFAAGDRYADCDESGELDFFDFLCFQRAFAAGCP